jgi:RHS repeat-associated protein
LEFWRQAAQGQPSRNYHAVLSGSETDSGSFKEDFMQRTNSFVRGQCLALGIMLMGWMYGHAAPAAPNTPAPAQEYDQTSERGPHHKRIDEIVAVPDATGKMVQRRSRYIQLENNLHYLEGSQWKESQEIIQAHPRGAAALQGAYQVIFGKRLNRAGAIEITSSDGEKYSNQPLGLYYLDRASGKSVELSLMKDCTGEILPPNQVIYRDAFAAVRADLKYIYRKGRFEADIILRERPPGPETFGLDPQTTSLEMVTEFKADKEPQKNERALKKESDSGKRAQMAMPDIVDEELDFGGLRMIQGVAFALNEGGLTDKERGQTEVFKRWMAEGSRRLLSEQVEHKALTGMLAQLPSAPARGQQAKEGKRSWPPTAAGESQPGPMNQSSVGAEGKGVVLDYIMTLNGSAGSFDFVGGTTYYIPSSFTVTANASFGSGAVVKYGRNAFLTIFNAVSGGGAILTAVDDNTVGDTISGSTGNPTGTYASFALQLCHYGGCPVSSPCSLSSIQIKYAYTGVYTSGLQDAGSPFSFNSFSISSGLYGIYNFNSASGATVTANGLFTCGVLYPTAGQVNLSNPSTCSSGNNPPIISPISGRFTQVGQTTPNIAFLISDENPSTVNLSASFSPAGIVQTYQFGGSGASRTIQITPGTSSAGTVTATLIATDGLNATGTNQFALTIDPLLNDADGFSFAVTVPAAPSPNGLGGAGGSPAGGGGNGNSGWPDLGALRSLRVNVENTCGTPDFLDGFTRSSETIKFGGGDYCPGSDVSYRVTIEFEARLRKAWPGNNGDKARLGIGGQSYFIGADERDGSSGCQMQTKTSVTNAVIRSGDVIVLEYSSPDTHSANHGILDVAYVKITRATIDMVLVDGEPCPECIGGSFSSVAVENHSVGLDFGLSGSTYGRSPIRLGLYDKTLCASLSSPERLYLAGAPGSDIDVVRLNPTNAIRQIKTPKGLVDIVTNSVCKYYVFFYGTNALGNGGNKNANGLYVTNGIPPLKTYEICNPSGDTNNPACLRILETRGGTTFTNEYLHIPAGGNPAVLQLARANGQRFIKRQYETNGTERIETRLVHRWTNAPAIRKAREKFQTLSFGEALTERTLDPDGAQLKTSHAYYTSTNDNGYGQLKQTIFPGGRWQNVEYNGQRRVTRVYNSFLNAAPNTNTSLSRTTEYDYTTNVVSGSGDTGAYRPQLPRREIEYALGQEVSRKYYVYRSGEKREIVCTTPGAAWNDSTNLVTITKRLTSGFFQDELQSVQRPDGTLELYQYATNSTSKTTTVWVGQPGAAGTNVVAGTKTVTVVGLAGQMISNQVFDIASGLLTSQELHSNYDEQQRPRRVDFLDGTYTETIYGCCGPDSVRQRDGTVVTYGYDDLKRKTSETVNGISTLYTFDADGKMTVVRRQGTDGSIIVLKGMTYDLAGRLVAETNALGGVTFYSEIAFAQGGTTRTTTNPDGGTRIETFAQDGALVTVTGTAARPVRYEYGVESDGGISRLYTKEIKLDANGADTAEWTKSYQDMLGRNYKTVAAGGPTNQSFFNNLGQLSKQVDPDGVTTLNQYNAKGELEITALDINRDGAVNLNGTDRITQTVSDVLANYGTTVRRTRTYEWATDNNAANLLTGTTEVSIDGLRTWTTRYGLVSTTVKTVPSNGAWTETAAAPDGTKEIRSFQNGRLASVTRQDANGVSLGGTTYAYDPHGRQASVTDARTGATSYTHNNADQAVTVTTPIPGAGYSAQTTTTFYNTLGQPWKVTQPDGTSLTNEFFVTGDLKKTSGSRTYPVEYTYDAQGRRKTMKTWQNFASGTGSAITTWNYDPGRGLLLNKRDAANQGCDYTYTAAGRPLTRVWARGNPRLTTTYAYNNAGEMQSVSYNDGVTPATSYGYDRRGRTTSTVRNGLTTTLSYNDAGLPLAESYSGGILSGLAVTRAYDSLLRPASVSLNPQPGTLNSYAYDTAGRLSSVSSGAYSATYHYLANSPMVDQVTFQQSTTLRLTTSKAFDNLNRLSWVSNASFFPVSAHAYHYNAANQRDSATMEDGSYWTYGYDTLGQVTSAKKRWSDGTWVAGQQFEYGYDDIGNRLTTKAGGDAGGASLRTASYSPNSLNQYASRTVPGAVDLLGWANRTATVTVNGQSTYRRNEYYQTALTLNNSGGPVWAGITVSAILGGNTVNRMGNLFLPPATESFTHDLDGNQTQDGRWIYSWDGENRLKQLESLSSAPQASKRKVVWEYDWRGRRIRQTEYNGSSGSYAMTSDLKFLYDGWRCVAELNAADNALLRSGVWGLDMSGSLDGAGGVGGLLMLNSVANGVHFYNYDGNGNVSALVKATDGTVSANYEYDPFGQTLRATGPMALENPYRFSTKYTDNTTDFVYYGHRFYNPSDGRWPSRDPIREDGGVNLYALVSNDPCGKLDLLGKYEIDFHFYAIYYLFCAKCYSPEDAQTVAWASQHVDDDPATDPLRLGRRVAVGPDGEQAAQTLANFHFYGSGPNTVTARNPSNLALQISTALSNGDFGGAGAFLHTFADSWSHEGFTAWWSDLNRRTGGGRPNIGHADAPEGGHAPDRPYNDVPRALEAALAIFDLIPDRPCCPESSRSRVTSDLQSAFSYRQEDIGARVQNLQARIRARFGETPHH